MCAASSTAGPRRAGGNVEPLADVLKRLAILDAISRASTDTSSSTEPEAADPAPRCPRCHDAGFVRREVPVGHPDFGKAVPCACRAEALREQRRQRLARLSNLGPLTRLTFDNLVKDGRRAASASVAPIRLPWSTPPRPPAGSCCSARRAAARPTWRRRSPTRGWRP